MQGAAQAARCARTLDAVLAHPGTGLGTPSLEARNPVQLCTVALSLTGDAQRRLPCVKSIALTAVIPTSIRMAASKTKTIKEVLLVLPKDVQVCRQSFNSFTYQWLAMALPPARSHQTSPRVDTDFLHPLYWDRLDLQPGPLFKPSFRLWLGLAESD